jgi:hypothetical protein
LIKKAVLLIVMASLVGRITASPVVVKVDASVKVVAETTVSVSVGAGKAQAKPKATAKAGKKSKTTTAKTTKARTAKGKGIMNKPINVVKKNGGHGMVVAGEGAPNRG